MNPLKILIVQMISVWLVTFVGPLYSQIAVDYSAHTGGLTVNLDMWSKIYP